MALPARDLHGVRVGYLTALERLSRKTPHGDRFWRCRCDCGVEIERSYNWFTSKTHPHQSCGCRTPKSQGRVPQDVTGQLFGWLTAVRSTNRKTDKGIIWECQCRCGTILLRPIAELRRKPRFRKLPGKKIPKSCGCARAGVRSPRYLGAGSLSGQKWSAIKNGAKRRGLKFTLTIQEAWVLFEAQGRRCALTGTLLELHPNSMAAGANTASLDRINSSKGYVKGNVQWVHVSINLMKQTLSNDQFVFWCKAVAGFVVGSEFGLSKAKGKEHHY